MQECTSFAEVYSGSDLPSLVKAIEEALVAGNNSTYRESVLRQAYANSWDVRAEAYLNLLHQSARSAVS